VRFIHTADLHIGKTLGAYDLLEDQAHILSQILDLAIRQKADALLIAGDIYDRSLPGADAVRLADNFFTAAAQKAGIPIILTSGNHDSADRLGFCSGLLGSRGFHLCTRFEHGFTPIVLEDSAGPIDIYGMPFLEPIACDWARERSLKTHEELWTALSQEFSQRFKAEGPRRRLLLAHCFTTGGSVSDSERSLTIGGSAQVPSKLFEPFNFTALGHLHRCQQIATNIWYSGSPLGYSASEANQNKFVVQIDMDDSGTCHTEKLLLAPIRKLKAISGSFSEIIAQDFDDATRQAYVWITLQDSEPVFEAFHRLSEKFSRLIHVGRESRSSVNKPATDDRSTVLELSDIEIIRSFHLYCTESPLSANAEATIQKLLEQSLVDA